MYKIIYIYVLCSSTFQLIYFNVKVPQIETLYYQDGGRSRNICQRKNPS
jgi:hypothetical protein